MDKDITLAALVPAGWLGGLVLLVAYMLVSPVLFIVALFRPEGLEDLPDMLLELIGGAGQSGG